MRNFVVMVGSIGFFVALLSSCNKQNQTPVAFAQETPVYAVNTTSAARGQIQDYLLLSGDIIAGSTVDAYPEIAGKITKLSVSVGSRVEKGAVLATVDPSRGGMNYIPSTVRSPISGTIIALPARVGMTVSQQVTLARIAAGQSLEIKVNVAERFISKLAVGLNCAISLDAYPGESFSGVVSELSPTIDPASRTMEVKITIDNTSNRLKSGMFAKVKIITEVKNDIIKIPASALIERFGEKYVFVVERDTVKRRTIKQGILIDNIVEIQEGLRAGEDVVIRGQSLLEDGSKVNIVERVATL
ncbi:MAG: efflux RND transporter periplasmic adaptor subunit [Spirochaetaceae bacterium]|jgi:multidrug efflux pump subunit AcrA (membrane-fusion protein)|nr:efflux RND transporter periplasmic adaptor subunit [Spirochaetaceae bacterium]